MILHITKKLADKLKLSPTVESAKNELHSWRANYIQEAGYRFVVIMNDVSRFTIVINNTTAVKLKKLPALFIQTLRLTLLALGNCSEFARIFGARQGSADDAYWKMSARRR